MPEPVDLDAGQLRLRSWTAADAPQVAAAAGDPLIRRWNPLSRSSAAEWCAAVADWSTGRHATWAVVARAQPALILGNVSLHGIDPGAGAGEIGFWVVPAARRRGVAATAVRAATAHGFQVLGLRRITLFHAVGNAGSCAVAAAAGYPREGVHRASHRYGDGQWHDEHSHARLAGDPAPQADRPGVGENGGRG